jgi:hypothetical protein
MKTQARHRREERAAKLILLLIVVIILGLFSWGVWLNNNNQMEPNKLKPKPTSLSQKSGYKLVQTDCFEFYLPDDFEVGVNADCLTNAYARPRKHSYFNIAPYYGVDSEQAMIEKWRDRWLTLGAKEVSLDRVTWAGKTAWRAEEEYPQNGQRFVSYLLFLGEDLFRVDGRSAIAAFELRGWASSQADRELANQVLQDWHWRF